MASQVKQERYKNATIDCADMTLTEFEKDESRTYSLKEILERWDGIDGVTFTIQRREDLPAT